ncbi:hypothetical protein IG631_00506 [Alternaria alternata]|jgi:hypothetical protein|nr:hypothetical protein IG631_00506 [Alternaria alternata]
MELSSEAAPLPLFMREAAPLGLTSHSETRLNRATSTSTFNQTARKGPSRARGPEDAMLSKRVWCLLTGSFVVHAAMPGRWLLSLNALGAPLSP